MADRTITLTDAEWQQLVAIIANATSYMTFTKLVNQLQGFQPPPAPPRPGDGLDPDPPAELLRPRS